MKLLMALCEYWGIKVEKIPSIECASTGQFNDSYYKLTKKEIEGSSKFRDVDRDAAWKIATDRANDAITALYPPDYPDKIHIENHRMRLIQIDYKAMVNP